MDAARYGLTCARYSLMDVPVGDLSELATESSLKKESLYSVYPEYRLQALGQDLCLRKDRLFRSHVAEKLRGKFAGEEY